MIILIHGDNLISSRNYLSQLLKGYKEKGFQDLVNFNGATIDFTDFIQATESKSLLTSQRLIVIENLLSATPSGLKNQVINYLNRFDAELNLILWESRLLKANQIKSLKKVKVSLFKLSPKIFKFLDSLTPNQSQAMLSSLQESKISDTPELIFYMLSRRINQLILLKDSKTAGLTGLQEWQKSRLTKQANNFSLIQLIAIHNRLYQTDFEIKTGNNILPLASQLDLIVADI